MTIHLEQTGDFNTIQTGTSQANSSADLRITSIGTSGSTYMTISTSGNIGIGTTSPSVKLHTLQTSNSDTAIFESNANFGSVIQVKATAGNGRNFKIQSTASGDGSNPNGAFVIDDATSGTRRFVIDATGKVGIGINIPRQALDVTGNITTDWISSDRFIGSQFTDGTTYRLGMTMNGTTRNLNLISQTGDNTGNITFVTGSTPTERMRVTAGGNIGIGTNSPTTAKVVISGAPGSTGLDLASTDQYVDMRVVRNSHGDKDMFIQYGAGSGSKLRLFSNNTETMVLNNSNVGIGTSSPNAKLHVAGLALVDDIKSNRAAYIAIQDGNNNTLIWTNGIGLYPNADNSYQLGYFANRWTVVNAVNGTVQTSDSTLKNFVPLIYGVNELSQIETIKYTWKSQEELPEDDPSKHFEYYGFKAENLASLFPELVYDETPDAPLQVNYSEILPVCVNAIKELNAKYESEKQEHSITKSRLDTLEMFIKNKFPGEI